MADVRDNGSQVQGNVAHDAVDVGNPVKLGGKVSTAQPTAVSAGDRVDAWFDEYGRLTVVGPIDVNQASGAVWDSTVAGSISVDSLVTTKPVHIGARASTAIPTAVSDDGDMVHLWADRNGRLMVGDGSGSITVDNNGTFVVQPVASSSFSAGATHHFDSDADNSVQTIKGSAGCLYGLEVHNPNTVDVFVQLFDASGPTVGTTAPSLSFLVPAAASSTRRGAMDKVFPIPIAFTSAIKYAVTTTPTGSTAPTSDVTLNAIYK